MDLPTLATGELTAFLALGVGRFVAIDVQMGLKFAVDAFSDNSIFFDTIRTVIMKSRE